MIKSSKILRFLIWLFSIVFLIFAVIILSTYFGKYITSYDYYPISIKEHSTIAINNVEYILLKYDVIQASENSKTFIALRYNAEKENILNISAYELKNENGPNHFSPYILIPFQRFIHDETFITTGKLDTFLLSVKKTENGVKFN